VRLVALIETVFEGDCFNVAEDARRVLPGLWDIRPS
jgi:hypothetical protein